MRRSRNHGEGEEDPHQETTHGSHPERQHLTYKRPTELPHLLSCRKLVEDASNEALP
jgi:hypothetical protein